MDTGFIDAFRGDLGPPLQTRVVMLQMGHLAIPWIGRPATGRPGLKLKALQAMASMLRAPRRPLRSV